MRIPQVHEPIRDQSNTYHHYSAFNKHNVELADENSNGLFSRLRQLEDKVMDFIKKAKDEGIYYLNRKNLHIFNTQLRIIDSYIQKMYNYILTNNNFDSDLNGIAGLNNFHTILKNSENESIDEDDLKDNHNSHHAHFFKLNSDYTHHDNDLYPVHYTEFRIYLGTLLQIIASSQDMLRELLLMYRRDIVKYDKVKELNKKFWLLPSIFEKFLDVFEKKVIITKV